MEQCPHPKLKSNRPCRSGFPPGSLRSTNFIRSPYSECDFVQQVSSEAASWSVSYLCKQGFDSKRQALSTVYKLIASLELSCIDLWRCCPPSVSSYLFIIHFSDSWPLIFQILNLVLVFLIPLLFFFCFISFHRQFIIKKTMLILDHQII